MAYDVAAQILEQQMKAAGYEVPSSEVIPRMFISSTAMTKRGKSYFACRAPDPIAGIAFDAGTEHQVKKAMIEEGKKIFLTNLKVKKVSEGGVQRDWTAEWGKFKKAFTGAVSNKSIRTVFVDTGDASWELAMLQHFGTDKPRLAKGERYSEWGELNQEFRSVFMDAYESRPDLNIIVIHKTKKEYAANNKGDDAWTGRYERAGFKDMSFLADVNIEHYFDTETKEFGIRVLDSRENFADVVGLEMTGPLCSFNELAMQVWAKHDKGRHLAYWNGRHG